MCLLKILIEHACLNALVILVLAAIVGVIVTLNGVVKDLADIYPRVDTNGLDTENLQRPEAIETHIAKARSHVNEKPQPTNGGAALQHGYVL